MHAPKAYLDGGVQTEENMEMLNTLLASAKTPASQTADEKQAERERQSESASGPGGFRNDPDDASNPNEVRERHLEKLDKTLKR